MKAIDTHDKEDDKQWLSYWVVVGLIEFAENFPKGLFKLFPFYYLLKSVVVVWLMMPNVHVRCSI
ncbi:hypothetical protein HDV03_004987 [Kappamyces sp. JEL0829]|nr:hypothetical protein HDV03_004987 [Kappamyces sp. JEL0829]